MQFGGTPAAEEIPLAIQGYDPVAYFTDGRPVRGLPEFAYQWDDYRWHFASAAHRDMFKADPVRHAPQFGDYCAMALSLGQVVVANPENWLIRDGKLYVFGKPTPAGPALFQKNVAANIDKTNRNRSILTGCPAGQKPALLLAFGTFSGKCGDEIRPGGQHRGSA